LASAEARRFAKRLAGALIGAKRQAPSAERRSEATLPIPFHDTEDLEALGAAAFLHVEQPAPGSPQRYGALLFLNARGEPLEFVYNRIELLSDVLWRPIDRARSAVRRLAITLFHEATLTPALLLCRADTIDPHLFGPHGQIALAVPVGRIATAAEAVGYAGTEQQETVETADSSGEVLETHVFWTPRVPTEGGGGGAPSAAERPAPGAGPRAPGAPPSVGPPDGAAAGLFARLAARGLLLEPFERAGRGLRELYGDPLGSRK
jgi:hypothetical protein